MGARIAIHTESIPFVPHRPGTAATARYCHCTFSPPPSLSLFFSLALSRSLSLSLLLSPNFVANLRATKSAPFDFTLIRCRCRAIDEASLSLYAGQRPKGISFSAVRAIPSPEQVCFKVTSSPHPRARYSAPSIVPVFLCALLSFRSSRLYTRSLSSPLLST